MNKNEELENLRADLIQVNLRIGELTSGKMLNALKIRSSSFSREYTYNQVTLPQLLDLRKEILSSIHVLEESAPVYNNNAWIQNAVYKKVEF